MSFKLTWLLLFAIEIVTLQAANENVAPISQNVRQHYIKLATQTQNINQFLQDTKSDIQNIKTINNLLKYFEEATEFRQQIQSLLHLYDISYDKSDSEEIDQISDVIANIPKQTKDSINIWKNKVDTMIKESELAVKWYSFIVDLEEELNTFEIQTKREMYNVKNIEEWGQTGRQQGLVVDNNNYKEFIQTVLSHFPNLRSKYEDVLDSEIPEDVIQDLNLIVGRSLREVLDINKDGDSINIFGHSVTLSEAATIVRCIYETSNVTEFSILATRSVIIDTDARFHPKIKLSIYAPFWVSDNNPYTIDLSGQNAQIYDYPNNESDGRPGLPGENGGSFVGLGEKSSSLILSVFANGGHGSDGEDGLDGHNGTSSATNPMSYSPCKYVTEGYGDYAGHRTVLYFDERACGGDGGDGGVGGIGGMAGTASVEILQQNTTLIYTEAKDGWRGRDGKGGKGGFGGRNDYYLEEYCTPSCGTPERRQDSWYVFPPGRHGHDAANDFGIVEPLADNDPQFFQRSLKKYQEYISRFIMDKFLNKRITNFYDLIQKKLN